MKFKKYISKKIENDVEFKKIHDKYDLRFEVAELITEARIYKNLTQKELANLVGTRQSSISRIENGGVLPNLSFLERIANAIGTQLIAPKFAFMVESGIGQMESISMVKNQSATLSAEYPTSFSNFKFPKQYA